jgi:hypothetical protein
MEEELTAAQPGVVDYRRLLSWCHNDIGLVLQRTGRLSEALDAYERSGVIKAKVAADHSDSV